MSPVAGGLVDPVNGQYSTHCSSVLQLVLPFNFCALEALISTKRAETRPELAHTLMGLAHLISHIGLICSVVRHPVRRQPRSTERGPLRSIHIYEVTRKYNHKRPVMDKSVVGKAIRLTS
jgi:hypothetical protein